MEIAQSRREFLKTTALSLASLGFPRLAQGQSSTKPPNVVIIFLDDSGWADFQPFASPGYHTPNVAQLAKEGCCYIGKIVTYPAGRYEESGSVYLDITSPHCMLVVGKRGTGKSYTLGVIAEGFGLLLTISERIYLF